MFGKMFDKAKRLVTHHGKEKALKMNPDYDPDMCDRFDSCHECPLFDDCLSCKENCEELDKLIPLIYGDGDEDGESE